MAPFRKMKSINLLKYLVVPTLFLCAIFKVPAFQWVAVTAIAVWLLSVFISRIAELRRTRKRKRDGKRLAKISSEAPQDASPVAENPENDLFLIRQINFRVTEQLKATYPAISWLWVKRPPVSELCKGGAWRIRLSNADPFNYGEVMLTETGKMSITLLQATPLKDAVAASIESNDLEDDEILDRLDVKTWYRNEGEAVLSRMIDDLNTQGHRKLMIHEDGEVIVTASGTELTVDTIRNFPPRMAWEEFCQVLKEDEITAVVKPEGLQLSW